MYINNTLLLDKEQQRKIRKSDKYLKFIRDQPCVICGGYAEPHHVRNEPTIHYALRGGASLKPSDYMSIPVCREHHEECERSWEGFKERYNFQPLPIISLLLIRYLIK